MIFTSSVSPLLRKAFYGTTPTNPDTDSEEEFENLDRSHSSAFAFEDVTNLLTLNSSNFTITWSGRTDAGTEIQAEKITKAQESSKKIYYFQIQRKGFPPIPFRSKER